MTTTPYLPVLDFRHPANGDPVRIIRPTIETADGQNVATYVAMLIDVTNPHVGGVETIELRFKDYEALTTFFMGRDGEVGPVGLAIAKYSAEQANRPVNVVKRAFQGSFADDDAQAEIIIKDLVEAGHLPKSALEDL